MSTVSIITPILSMFQSIILFICKAIGIAILPFFVMTFFFMIVFYIKGKRRKKPTYRKTYKKPKKLKVLLIDFPRRLALDWYNRNPDALHEYGVHLFAGEQGSGKSIAVAWMILKLKAMYPACQIGTNIDFKDQNFKVESPEDFIMRNNGELGMIIFLDEIQNWFSSMESKNFPVEALEDITQQRKQRKIFIGTSQVFTRVAKPIREQTTLLYKPFTIAGCLTFVRIYKAKLDEAGTVKKEKLRKLDFFVHTDELRNAYNTYERVERLTQKGYKPRQEQLTNDNNFNLNLNDLDL